MSSAAASSSSSRAAGLGLCAATALALSLTAPEHRRLVTRAAAEAALPPLVAFAARAAAQPLRPQAHGGGARAGGGRPSSWPSAAAVAGTALEHALVATWGVLHVLRSLPAGADPDLTLAGIAQHEASKAKLAQHEMARRVPSSQAAPHTARPSEPPDLPPNPASLGALGGGGSGGGSALQATLERPGGLLFSPPHGLHAPDFYASGAYAQWAQAEAVVGEIIPSQAGSQAGSQGGPRHDLSRLASVPNAVTAMGDPSTRDEGRVGGGGLKHTASMPAVSRAAPLQASRQAHDRKQGAAPGGGAAAAGTKKCKKGEGKAAEDKG